MGNVSAHAGRFLHESLATSDLSGMWRDVLRQRQCGINSTKRVGKSLDGEGIPAVALPTFTQKLNEVSCIGVVQSNTAEN